MKKNKHFLFLSALLLLVGSCTTKQLVKQVVSMDRTVEILAVNDMHAALDNFPRFAYIVDSLRQIYPDLLLFSAGDNQTGNPVNDQFQPKGKPMIDLMNALKFDLSAVGNHEFDTKPEGFSYGRFGQFRFYLRKYDCSSGYGFICQTI